MDVALDQVLTWPVERIGQWVQKEVREGIHRNPFNWLGLSSAAATHCYATSSDLKESLAWARIKIFIDEALAHQNPSVDSLQWAAMSMRAYMIKKMGAKGGDWVLDPKVILDWCQGLLDIPLEEALKYSRPSNWQVATPERMLKIRGNGLMYYSLRNKSGSTRRVSASKGMVTYP